ncbi:transglycosylase SLT domain-containing protein [Photobacterium sanguinicancri]|uniref:transglycosylase SLT domain-containing protein n=1 Tax=Photobacterium sanguinicancri TaxID=875932 RepID=UPI003D0B7A74
MLITLRQGLLALSINLILVGGAHANDPFAELDQEVNQLSADHTDEFNLWYAEHIREFNAWQMANLAEWDKQNKASMTSWGDTKTPSQDTIVIYDQTQQARTVVDLASGDVTISYKLHENAAENPDKSAMINQIIEDNTELFETVGLVKHVEPASAQEVEVTEVAIKQAELDAVKQAIKAQTERQMSQLDIYVEQDTVIADEQQKAQIIAAEKKAMIANENQRIARAEQDFSQTQSAFKQAPMKLVSYQVRIPETAVSNRANRYMPYITQESKKHEIPVPLVLAIMHTESHFNPKAKSHVPAYGLMQIVPTSAGHDVNKLYRGKNKPMRASELYDPKTNIETGAAYLSILQDRYLRGIKDPKSSMYSVIAAYNTGSGNVAKAFGERSVRAAVKKINTMTSKQVYQQLITNLPYEETRNYLKKVNKQVQNYQQPPSYSMI